MDGSEARGGQMGARTGDGWIDGSEGGGGWEREQGMDGKEDNG